MARALVLFFSRYGVFENLYSDPGSDLTSEVGSGATDLIKWYGGKHRFSLVDRHESNGVEESLNKLILQKLKALDADERIRTVWSKPEHLGLIQCFMNSEWRSETGLVPFEAHFGSAVKPYLRLPAIADKDTGWLRVPGPAAPCHSLTLRTLREYVLGTVPGGHIIKKRTGSNTEDNQLTNSSLANSFSTAFVRPSGTNTPLPSKLT